MKPRVVVHVPHSSAVIPEDAAPALALTPAEILAELLVMTDWYTDDLFALAPSAATTVRFPVSRLVVDPERFTDDGEELMAAKGMGVVYTRTSGGRRLRPDPTGAQRAELLRRFYEPHHRRLTDAVTEALDEHGSCLVIDGHSFPSAPLPYEADQRPERPDICIGTDAHHTPAWLRDLAIREFERAGFSIAIDRPFAGALVPLAFYGSDKRVAAVMVEINRGLYMDERTGERLGDFVALRGRVIAVLEGLVGRWSRQ